MKVIYDIEVYPNLFLFCGIDVCSKETFSFEVSPYSDDRVSLLLFLRQRPVLIGFNNLSYDSQVLQTAIYNLGKRGRDFCNILFNKSKAIIGGKSYNYKKSFFKQVDLFKINHYDNLSKSTSLKELQFNLRMGNIQELPYSPDSILSKGQIDSIKVYCYNDVFTTFTLYSYTKQEIDLREKLSNVYGIDFTNYNSTKIGEQILVSKIKKVLGDKFIYNTDGSIRNTKRKEIHLSSIIFDYISFTSVPFTKLLFFLKSKVIRGTKSVFTEIDFDDLKILEPHYLVDKTKGMQRNLNIIHRGFVYYFGLGGIHGSITSGVYSSDDGYQIIDIDVSSYYPNLAIQNRFFPEHYGEEFCDIYQSIYQERRQYAKGTSENLALKLALNGSYGKSNSEYSPLYDPAFTMKITINGQLLLCMLSERFSEEVSGLQILQVNTDGITIRVLKAKIGDIFGICSRWEKLTNLQLEFTQYKKMIIADVNNYLAIKEDGNIKRKGSKFIYKQSPNELELHKNFSMLVVQKSVEAYFVDGIKPEVFLRNHQDTYDFFKRTKIRKTDTLISRNLKNQESIEQRITRYYISGEILKDNKYKQRVIIGSGDILIKKNNREFQIEAGYLCTICNNLTDLDLEKAPIYYPYYIKQIYKTINLITNTTNYEYTGQTSGQNLTLFT